MRRISIEPNKKKIMDRVDLKYELEKYETMLSKYTNKYLKDLLELNKSATESHTLFFDPDNYHLYELKIFRDLAIYNIYNRAEKLFKSMDDELIIEGNEDGYDGLYVSTLIGDRKVELYNFDYRNDLKVNIYKSVIDEKARQKAIEDVMNKLETLYDIMHIKHDSDFTHGVPLFGPASKRVLDLHNEIDHYEKLFDKLDKKDYADEDYKEAEITQKYHELILNEYFTRESEFIEESKNICEEKKVVRIPSLTLRSNITYL